jgi:hypothetical protein
MHRIMLGILAAALLSACTTNPVPEGYTGPLAKIQDTFTQRSERAVDMFFVDKVNGKKVENALTATTSRNYGRGFAMEAVAYVRDVPAAAATFSLTGRTHYAAPILELTNPVYEVKGDVNFAPAANRTYIVRGELRADYAAVWLEDAETKAVIGSKIELKGDPSLGVLEK